MKRTLVKNGIQERLNDLIGTDTPTSIGVLNDWSVQASMIENARRIARSIPGPHGDMVMNGLRTSPGDQNHTIHISAGIAITKAGEILVLADDIDNFVIAGVMENLIPDVKIYVYMKFKEESKPDRVSNIINGDSTNIIWDSAIDKDSVILSTTEIIAADHIYIGDFIYKGSSHTEHTIPFTEELTIKGTKMTFRYGVYLESKDDEAYETYTGAVPVYNGIQTFKDGDLTKFTANDPTGYTGDIVSSIGTMVYVDGILTEFNEETPQ